MSEPVAGMPTAGSPATAAPVTGTPARPARSRSSGNSENINGWAAVADKAVDRLFAPQFLAFLLVLLIVSLVGWKILRLTEIDGMLKLLAVISPLISLFAGYAFGKSR